MAEEYTRAKKEHRLAAMAPVEPADEIELSTEAKVSNVQVSEGQLLLKCRAAPAMRSLAHNFGFRAHEDFTATLYRIDKTYVSKFRPAAPMRMSKANICGTQAYLLRCERSFIFVSLIVKEYTSRRCEEWQCQKWQLDQYRGR